MAIERFAEIKTVASQHVWEPTVAKRRVSLSDIIIRLDHNRRSSAEALPSHEHAQEVSDNTACESSFSWYIPHSFELNGGKLHPGIPSSTLNKFAQAFPRQRQPNERNSTLKSESCTMGTPSAEFRGGWPDWRLPVFSDRQKLLKEFSKTQTHKSSSHKNTSNSVCV